MKTSVFVLFGRVSFSHEAFLGVYSSKEFAKRALRTLFETNQELFENYDSFHGYEKEIDSSIKSNHLTEFSLIPFEKKVNQVLILR